LSHFCPDFSSTNAVPGAIKGKSKRPSAIDIERGPLSAFPNSPSSKDGLSRAFLLRGLRRQWAIFRAASLLQTYYFGVSQYCYLISYPSRWERVWHLIAINLRFANRSSIFSVAIHPLSVASFAIATDALSAATIHDCRRMGSHARFGLFFF
jgi:hypothetical protein